MKNGQMMDLDNVFKTERQENESDDKFLDIILGKSRSGAIAMYELK